MIQEAKHQNAKAFYFALCVVNGVIILRQTYGARGMATWQHFTPEIIRQGLSVIVKNGRAEALVEELWAVSGDAVLLQMLSNMSRANSYRYLTPFLFHRKSTSLSSEVQSTVASPTNFCVQFSRKGRMVCRKFGLAPLLCKPHRRTRVRFLHFSDSGR